MPDIDLYQDYLQDRARMAQDTYTSIHEPEVEPDSAEEAIKRWRETTESKAAALYRSRATDEPYNSDYWQSRVLSQPVYTERMGNIDFANVMAPDVRNISYLESAWAWASGEPGKPTNYFGAMRNSMARGGYGLVNSLPFFGNIPGMQAIGEKKARLQMIADGIKAGKSNAELFGNEDDPTGNAGRALWDSSGKRLMEACDRQLNAYAVSAAWANRMAALYPQSDALKGFNDATGFSESMAEALKNPLLLLANIGPESLVQFAPAMALTIGSTVAGGGLGTAAALQGLFSYGLDANSTFMSGLGDLGIDATDPKAIKEFMANPNSAAYQKLLAESKAHAAWVAPLDAVSTWIAPKIVMPTKAPALLDKISPSSARVYEKAMTIPFTARIARHLGDAIPQAALGATGEAAGQLAAYGEVKSWSDVVAEAAGEHFSTPIEVATASFAAGRRLTFDKLKATKFGQSLEQIQQKIGNSPVVKKARDMVEDFADEVEKRHPGIGGISIDAESLKQDQFTVDTLCRLIPERAEQIRRAVDTGSSIQISLGEYASRVTQNPELCKRVIALAHQDGEFSLTEIDEIADSIVKNTAVQTSKILTEKQQHAEELKAIGAAVGKQMLTAGEDSGVVKSNVMLILTQLSAISADTHISPASLWNALGATFAAGSEQSDLAPDAANPLNRTYDEKFNGPKQPTADYVRDADGNVVGVSPQAQKVAKASGGKPVTLDQSDGKNLPLGQYLPSLGVIIRWANANESTFLHETGHLFLDMRVNVAIKLKQQGNLAPEQQRFVEHTEAVAKWLGAKSLEDFDSLPADKRTPMHEKFARHYEQYLREGRAPTTALRRVFSRFSKWLKGIYGALVTGAGQLSPEVAALYDGLFVSAQQEKEARLRRQMFTVMDMGGVVDDPKLAEEIQTLYEDAEEQARAALTARHLRAISVFRSMRGKIVNALTKKADKLLAGYEAEELAKLQESRQYKAVQLLTKGEKGTADVPALTPKFSIEELKAMHVSNDAIERLKAKKMAVPDKSRKAMQAEMIAQLCGYSSADELIQDVAYRTPDIKEQAKVNAELRLAEDHPELADEEQISRLADEAIHNPFASDMVAAEIAYFEKMTGNKRVTRAMFRDLADAQVRRTKLKDLKPKSARDDAQRARKNAAEAAAKGDRAAAARFLRMELYHMELAASMQEARDAVAKRVKAMRKYNRKEVSGMQAVYAEQLQTLLARAGLASESLATADTEYSQFVADKADKEHIALAVLDPEISKIISEFGRHDAKDDARSELMVDDVDAMLTFFENCAEDMKNADKIRVGNEMVERARIDDEISTSIDKAAIANGDKPIERGESEGKKSAFLDFVRKVGAAHARPAALLEAIEHSRVGTLWTYVIKVFDAASALEEKLKNEYTEKMNKALQPLAAKMRNHRRVYIKDLHGSFSPAELVAIALNLCNNQNIDRLLGGSSKYDRVEAYKDDSEATPSKHNWTRSEVINAVQENFSEEEILALQEAWNVCGGLWPKIVELEHKMGHRTPPKQEPNEITFVVGGKQITLPGGYYPIAYDRELSAAAAKQADASVKLAQQTGSRGSYTYQGFIKARAKESDGRPVRLTNQAGFSNLNDVIHDLCWREPLMNARKIFSPDGKTIDAISRWWSPAAVKAINAWLDNIAANGVQATNMSDRIADWFRQNVSLAGLGFNVVTAAVQVVGIAQTTALLGPKYTKAGVYEMLHNGFKGSRQIVEGMSDMMAARSRTRFRELAELYSQLNGNTGDVRQKIMQFAYWPIVQMQMMVDIPTWLGARQKAKDELAADASFRADLRADPQSAGKLAAAIEEEAIARADRTVLDAQGSGRISDMSQVESGTSWQKLATQFYTFFAAVYGAALIVGNTQKGMQRAMSIAMMFVAQPVLEAFLRGGIDAMAGGADDDWLEKTSKKALWSVPSFAFGTIVGLREINGIFDSLGSGESQMGYTGMSSLRKVTDFYRAATQVSQGEFDEGLFKALVSATGTLVGAPVAPINRAISGANALWDDDTTNPLVLLLGYKGQR